MDLFAPSEGTIDVAERLARLVLNAPAGGLFTHAQIDNVAGLEVPGFGGLAGFVITNVEGDRQFEVSVRRLS